jgi:biotin carboxylase
VKVLLTEGSGLASRQCATRLDELGHEVFAAVSDPVCLARFTRHVRHLVRVPPFGPDPFAWFDAVLEQAVALGIEVVFPTQEQVTVLSHQLPRLSAAGLRTAVPPFAALRSVQDKVSAHETLAEAGVAQPRSLVARDPSALASWSAFPAYVKAPVGTASSGVHRVDDARQLTDAAQSLLGSAPTPDHAVLVQEVADGPLVMAQSVFDRGAMVAFGANERVREGVNGSASVKRSTDVPELRGDLERLGRRLAWHGALSVDAIVTTDGPVVIDVNPRLVEPANAVAAGTDLVAALLAVAAGATPGAPQGSRAGVTTHQLLMSILGAAQGGGTRRDVAAEVAAGLTHRGVYAGSREELLPPRGDWRTVTLPVLATVATLVRPASYRWFAEGAVAGYALSPEGWRALCDTAPAGAVSPGAS